MLNTAEAMKQELAAMSDNLQDYLLDERLFRTITVSGPRGDRLIKMTIGAMLQRIEALEGQAGDEEAGRIVATAQEAIARAQENLTDRFYDMLAREAKGYTDSWNWFLQYCWEGERRCHTDYPDEVETRLRLERLLEAGGTRPALAESRQRVRKLDEQLRAIWQEEEECILDDCDRYPRERYWWLYGRPVPQRQD